MTISKLSGHTGPKMSVSSIAGDGSRTRVDIREREEKGKKSKSQSFYQLSYSSSFSIEPTFIELIQNIKSLCFTAIFTTWLNKMLNNSLKIVICIDSA